MNNILFVDSSHFYLLFVGLFQPIYAEVADPNYIPLMPGSYTCQTYQEFNSTHTNLETNECSNNTAPATIGIASQGYTNLKGMNPYINAP